MTDSAWHKRVTVRIAIVLPCIHVGLLGWGASRHSFTWTDVGLLPAGIINWRTGRFDVYRVSPPLVRMVGTLPVLLASPELPKASSTGRHTYRAEWAIGREMIRENGEHSLWLLTLARWTCIPFSLLGGYVCFRWTKELHGDLAGLVAMAIWCFSPNILAHGQLISGDVAAAALGVAAAYVFWRWLTDSKWKGAVGAGLLLGLAELTKTTWVVLFPLWPTVWLLWRWSEHRRPLWPGWGREMLQMAAILLLGVYLLNLGYGFERSFTKLGNYRFLSRTLAGEDAQREAGGNRFGDTLLSEVPVPLPKNYVQGMDLQKWDFERLRWSYLRGQWRARGWWYYYLNGLAIKIPLGTQILAILAVIASIRWRAFLATWRDEMFLLLPAIVVLSLVSSQLGLNKRLRYLLPAFPFLIIWVSKVAIAVPTRRMGIAFAALLALSWAVMSSLRMFPHSLSYFNESVGGPKNGHAHMYSSNVDWGQTLLYLKEWVDAHPEARPLHLSYFPHLVDPAVVGLRFPSCPQGIRYDRHDKNSTPEGAGPLPGWHIVSVCKIRERDKFEYFLNYEPIAQIGYSMNVYHIELEETNRVRRKVGLPEVNAAEAEGRPSHRNQLQEEST